MHVISWGANVGDWRTMAEHNRMPWSAHRIEEHRVGHELVYGPGIRLALVVGSTRRAVVSSPAGRVVSGPPDFGVIYWVKGCMRTPANCLSRQGMWCVHVWRFILLLLLVGVRAGAERNAQLAPSRSRRTSSRR